MENQEKKFLSPDVLSILSSKKTILLAVFVGVLLIVFGAFFLKDSIIPQQTKVEVLQGTTENEEKREVVVEIAGEVKTPGVYKLPQNSRVDELIIISGGLTKDADEDFIAKNINRAKVLADGQKVYIPNHSDVLSAKTSDPIKVDQSFLEQDLGGKIDINTASLEELDSLPGIGQIYGQNIIEHRPYSNIEELVSKGALGKSVFEKIKNQITAN